MHTFSLLVLGASACVAALDNQKHNNDARQVVTIDDLDDLPTGLAWLGTPTPTITTSTFLSTHPVYACSDAFFELFENLPTPDPELDEQIDDIVGEGTCVPSLPSSLSSQFQSFTSKWSSWKSAHSEQIESVSEACAEITGINESLSKALNPCFETGTPSSDDEEDADDNDGDDEGAAPQHRAMILGAMLASAGAVVFAL